jgi:hypothetical protein
MGGPLLIDPKSPAYDTTHDAARAIGDTFSDNTGEQAAAIIKGADGKYRYTTDIGGSQDHFDMRVGLHKGETLAGIMHSHPGTDSNANVFSPDDIGMANQLKVPSYVKFDNQNQIRMFVPGVTKTRAMPDPSYHTGNIQVSDGDPLPPPPKPNTTPPDTVVAVHGSQVAPDEFAGFQPAPAPSSQATPDEFADFAAAPQTSATTDFSDDDSPEAAEAKALTGGSEAVLHAASQIPASLGGGLTYLGTLAATGNPAAAESVRQGTQNALTYQPRTAQGQGVTGVGANALGAVAAPIAAAAQRAGEGTAEETGSPFLGAAEYTGLSAMGMLAGGGGARGTLAAEEAGVRGVPRPEPTAPSAPGGFTRDDFAPRPPEAAPAPTPAASPAPETPARVPVPGKPHITPKTQAQVPPTAAAAAEHIRAQEGEMGVAGAPEENPAPLSANGAETTPSAAPDAAGNPPLDIHDPSFFPAPDNQDLKSAPASPQEQVARQAAVERGAPTLPQVRDSAITNDYADQGRDWTGKQAGDPVATAQIAAEGQALHSEAARISSETGGQLGTGESADTARGRAYQDWHDTMTDALNKHINNAYAAEDAQAKQIATPASNLKGVLTDDSLIDSANAGSARSSTIALGQKMGVDLTDPNANLNAWQVEQLRKHAGTIYGNAPRFAQAIKNAADADLPQGAYQNARALRQLKGQMFDNRDGINQLGASKDINPDTGKPRPENRPVKAPQVMNKIESMDPDQVRHIVGAMKDSSTVLDRLGDHAGAQAITDKALKAAQQLQSHFTERWGDEAGKGGGWNQRRAHQFLTNNQETLAAVMSPDQLHQMRNVSNAANVLDMDKRYKGAFAQFRTGAGWLRKKLGRTAEGAITDMLPMGNTIGEMTGASEWLRNKLGGTEKANAPENFTRPLGEKLPGQRGAVGLLNKPGIVHDYDPATGEHTVTSPNGTTVARDAANGKDIIAQRDDTHPEAQGGGEATRRKMRLADIAAERGGSLHSDVSVSPAEAKVYSALGKSGYDIRKNPNARISETTGNLVSNDPREPVFTATKHSPGSSPQAGAVPGETTPLGRSIFGGRQAGYIGNPYESAKPAKDVWGNERNKVDRSVGGGNPYESAPAKANPWGGERTKADRSTPAGARLFGGKQRGAVGLDLNPKAEPAEAPARVNIGLHQGDPAAGGRVMKPGEAVAALRSQGVKVGKTSVQTGGSEPTLVADLNRPLSPEEGNAVAAKTGQQAIAQRHADGSGTMLGEGAQSAAAKAQGWDKYNSDYFQMHDGRSATEHDADHAAYNEIKPHLTADEQTSIEGRAGKNRATAIKNLMDAFHGSTSTEDTAAMALAGQAKKGWYKNSGKAISTVYGPDAPRFTALLAAMSPQTSVEMNFRNAIHVFKAWDEAGRPTEHAAIQKVMEDNSLKNPESTSKSNVMEAWRQNGIRALTSKDPEHENFQLSGPKVNSFYQNLRDNVHEVTNDSWNALALHVPQTIFGGAYKAAPGDIFGKIGGKSPGYMGASAKVRAAASHLSNLTGETWTPHETQETLWSFAKTAMEYNENAAKQAKAAGLPKPAEKTIPELIREGKINDDLIRSTPDFAHLFALAEHAGVLGSGKFAAGAKRLAKQTRNAPEPTGPSEASAAAAKTLRPALLEQAERLEGIRQQRIADKAAGRKERQIGNVQVPF